MKKPFTCSRCLPFIAAAAVAVFVSSSPVMAATTDKILSEAEITKSVLSQGYAQVIRMEMEDGQYEVKVKSKDGKRLKLNVDPKTGKVLGIHKDGLFSN